MIQLDTTLTEKQAGGQSDVGEPAGTAGAIQGSGGGGLPSTTGSFPSSSECVSSVSEKVELKKVDSEILKIGNEKSGDEGVELNDRQKKILGRSNFEKYVERVLVDGSKRELEDLRKIFEYQERIERLSNPAKFFEPNGEIEKVARAVGEMEHKKIFLLSAANSLGKTAFEIVCLANLIWRYEEIQNEYFSGLRYCGRWPYPKKFWYISDTATLKEFVCGTDENVSTENSEVRKWFPRNRYTFTKNGLDYYSRLTTDNGWTGSFKTYEQAVSQFESDKIGVLIFDEPPPKDIFKACMARLTLGGIVIMGMTPLAKSAWVADDLLPQATEDGPVFVLYGDIEGNCKQDGIRGRLDHDYIHGFLAKQYDDDEREARLHGIFTHFSGLVFKGLRIELHHPVVPEEEKFNQKDYRIIQVVDPHDAYPPFSQWYAVDRLLHVQSVDEYPRVGESGGQYFHQIKGFSKTTKEVCQEFRRIEQENGWDGSQILRVMDPNFGNSPKQTVGMKLHQFYAKCGREIGYPFLRYRVNVNDSLEAGHALIKEWLKPTPDGEVRFTITNRTPNLWYHFTHYTFKLRTGKRVEEDGQGEDVTQRFKAGIDVTRYLFMFLRGPKAEEMAPRKLEWYEEVYGQTPEYDILDPFSVRNTF